jgi:phage major head subunit gpT-like protein
MSVLKSSAATTLDTLNQAIQDDFQDALTNTPVAVDAFTDTRPTNAPIVNFPLLGVTSGMKEWVDTKKIGNLKLDNIVVTIKDWEDTIKIPRNAIDDDQLGIYSGIGARHGRTGRLLKQDLVAYQLQNGTTITGFDGKAIFATDHPLNPAANQSNNFTSTALSAANYASVRASMEGFLGSDGKPLGVTVTHLIVPPALRKTAEDILIASTLSTGGANTLAGSAQLVVVPQLANEPTVWYVACADIAPPVIYLEREAPKVTALVDPTSENVFWRKEYVWSVEARGQAFIPLWFCISRCIA